MRKLGLSQRRTFDRLREKRGSSPLFVFARDSKPHPVGWPDCGHGIVGPLEAKLAAVRAGFAGQALLVYAAFGTGDAERDLQLARSLAIALLPLLGAGGNRCERLRTGPDLEALALPVEVEPRRYGLDLIIWREPLAKSAVPPGGAR